MIVGTILKWGDIAVLGGQEWSRGLVLGVLAREKLERKYLLLS
jgi:hypothetical protein